MEIPFASRPFKAASEGDGNIPSPSSLRPARSLHSPSSGPARLIVSTGSLCLSLPRLWTHLYIGFEGSVHVSLLPGYFICDKIKENTIILPQLDAAGNIADVTRTAPSVMGVER